MRWRAQVLLEALLHQAHRAAAHLWIA